MHADVDEGAERGDVGDDALEHHAGLAGPRSRCTSSRNFGGSNSARGSRPGFSSSATMSLQRRLADAARRRTCARSILLDQRRRCRPARRPATPRSLGHPLDERVALGVHGAGVERVLAAADAQEARRLLERLRPEPRHLEQLACAMRNAPVLVAVRRRCSWPASRRCRRRTRAAAPTRCSARRRRGSRSSRRPRRAPCSSSGLVDVVLVLADADRLGVDLHQLGQRILQAPGDRDRAAHGEVEVGELLARDLATPSRPRRPPR